MKKKETTDKVVKKAQKKGKGTTPTPLNVQEQINNEVNRRITQFFNFQPNSCTRSDKEWKRLKELIKKTTTGFLTNLASIEFEYEMPEELDERVLERGFIERGQVVIFNDPVYGLLGLPCERSLNNLYYNPTLVLAYGWNDYVKPVEIRYNVKKELPSTVANPYMEDPEGRYGVFAMDNDDKDEFRMRDIIERYAQQLSDLQEAIIVASQRLKDPFILVGFNKAMQKNVNRLVQKIKDNDPDIFLINEDLKTMSNGSIKNLMEKYDLSGNPQSPGTLMQIYNAVRNEFLEIVGINTNPSPDKSQVVLTPEINANNILIQRLTSVRLKNREKLCKDAKKILGIDMSVKIRNQDEMQETANEIMKGDENDTTGNEKMAE